MSGDLFGNSREGRHVDPLRLLSTAANQISCTLKQTSQNVDTLRVLASYFTRSEPSVHGVPFCEALANATIVYQLQLYNVPESDLGCWLGVIEQAIVQILAAGNAHHPFLTVLQEAIFGMGGLKPHCVVMTPPQNFRAFAFLTCGLVESGVLPSDLSSGWIRRLEEFTHSSSPMVAYRSKRILIRITDAETVQESMFALHEVLRKKSSRLNVDFLLLCFERLQRVVVDPVRAPPFARALCVITSELFLRFRSPIRRQYVECYLFPSLTCEDTVESIKDPQVRKHMARELLKLCTPNMPTSCPYYLCLCALLRPLMVDEEQTAVELVNLFDSQMPHAAYFVGTLALDKNLSVKNFAQIILQLVKGAGYSMNGRTLDQLSNALDSTTMVYNTFFVVREVVTRLSANTTTRSSKVLLALRSAVPINVIDALSQFAERAFDGLCDIPIEPKLLCAEIGMILHHHGLSDAIDAVLNYLRDSSTTCPFCSNAQSSSVVCPVNGNVHLLGNAACSRVMTVISRCCGSPDVHKKLVHELRMNPCDPALHFLILTVLDETRQHRGALEAALDPYLSDSLSMISRSTTPSNDRANLIAFHSKLLWKVTQRDARALAMLKKLSMVPLSNNQDALSTWYAANFIVRNSPAVELAPLHSETFAAGQERLHAGQLLLSILDRCHSYSDEMRKLTGACVCKLIQDFNLQASNIVHSLLAPFGSVECATDSLVAYALPSHPTSTFWTFVARQLHKSPPMRTSFLVTLIQSVASRFRCADPAGAISGDLEEYAPLFVTMSVEVIKRAPSVALQLMLILETWVQQGQHSPGKYLCLMYCYVQMAFAVRNSRIFLESKRSSDTSNGSIDGLIVTMTRILSRSTAFLDSQCNQLKNITETVNDNQPFVELTEKVFSNVEVIGRAEQTYAESGDENAPEADTSVLSGWNEYDGADEDDDDDQMPDVRDASINTDDDILNKVDAILAQESRADTLDSAPASAIAEVAQQDRPIQPDRAGAPVPAVSRPSLNAEDAGVSIPSDVVFSVLSSVQSCRSIIVELEQMDARASTKVYNSVAHVVAPFEVSMEPRPNNYSEPHGRSAALPDSKVNVAFTGGHQLHHFPQEKENQPELARGTVRRYLMGQPQDSLKHDLAEEPQQARGTVRRYLGGQPQDSLKADLGIPSRQSTADTPHHAVPVELVEQGHDTALRELRQMTSRGQQSTSFGMTNPVPAYAADPQYSLEFI